MSTAVELLTAERIEPGEYTIIASPWVTGTLVHESFGHGVETDMFLKERAKAAQYVDKVVGSPLVNIWDDLLSRRIRLVLLRRRGDARRTNADRENGVFRRGITDLYSATILGIPRSANGRRQDFTRKAYARMTNTAHAGGRDRAGAVRPGRGRHLSRDVVVGHGGPAGLGHPGDLPLRPRDQGRPRDEQMFAPIGITGYVPDVLASVRGVGSEWGLDTGGCGKGHKELVSVAAGGPHLLMKARLG